MFVSCYPTTEEELILLMIGEGVGRGPKIYMLQNKMIVQVECCGSSIVNGPETVVYCVRPLIVMLG